MNRAATVLVLAALSLTAGCGGENSPDEQGAPTASPAATQTATQTATPTEDAGPEYTALSKAQLEASLLTIQDMPPGYSQDPPSGPTSKTFCDYKPPFAEDVRVSRDFTKGGGMASEFLSVGLRQYGNIDEARASFDALTKALSTCHEETYEGTKLEYALMSTPKVGDATIGVRITADGTTLLQNFALVGPTLINTGGGGPIQSDADEIAGLLEAQVKAYQEVSSE